MIETLEVRLQQLRVQQQEANRRHIQAEAKVSEIQARRESAMAELKNHGWETVEEAVAEVQRLTDQIESTLGQIESKVAG